MAIYCVVFDLQQPRDEYTQFFSHLDKHQGSVISPHCRLVFAHNSADVLMRYLENFIFSADTLFVAELSSLWALNKNFEATEWLRELQSLNELHPLRAPEITHNPPSV